MLACCAGWASLNVDSSNQVYSMGSQVSRADESIRSSNSVTTDSILRCGLVDSALIRLLPRCIDSTYKYSQKEMIATIAQDLNVESFFDDSLLTDDTDDSIKIAIEAKELQKRLSYCSSFIAGQISRELTKDPDAAAETITVKLAGDSSIDDITFGRESFKRYSNQCKEQNVQLFTLLSSLCTTTLIRPEIWFQVRLGTFDIPLLLIEIVSGSLGTTSLEQTILKLCSNTIDQLRLYMSLRSYPVSEVSSMVFPKNRGLSTGVTVVTVRFCPDSWKFCASFDNIPISEVCTVMKNILRRHCHILRSDTLSSVPRPWYLVKIYDLPSKTVQIASKHNIVLKQERPGGTVFLKYSPRIRDREQLLELVDPKINFSLDGVNRVAVRPSSWERIKTHRFMSFRLLSRLSPKLEYYHVFQISLSRVLRPCRFCTLQRDWPIWISVLSTWDTFCSIEAKKQKLYLLILTVQQQNLQMKQEIPNRMLSSLDHQTVGQKPSISLCYAAIGDNGQ